MSGVCSSCDIFHTVAECACSLLAEVTVRSLPGRVGFYLPGNVSVEHTSCFHTAENCLA